MVSSQFHYTKRNRFMPFLLAEILNFQGSTHHIGVGSFSNLLTKIYVFMYLKDIIRGVKDMIKIDLITGFLGAGKTTFIKKYASYLMKQGKKIGILENDFGAINVDMLLLQDLEGDNCTLEMIAGGCDADCHRRRFKTKLIAMAMEGYDRVIVEPSGIYDVDEFFDTLYEEPLDRFYEPGNVIALVDAGLEEDLSKEVKYLLASEVADAGCVLFSKCDEVSQEQLKATLSYLNQAMEQPA